MRRRFTVPLTLLSLICLSTAATLWASTVPPRPLARDTGATPARREKIEPYRPRFGRQRPLIAIAAENSATELTDFVIPYGILAEADVADLVTVSTAPGVVNMRPALHLQADTTMAAFDAEHPQGADYVIVPAMVRHDDRRLSRWIAAQSAKGATIVSICDGALVVANAGLMSNHRATAHWATLAYRREHFPDVTWVENSRYVADGRIVSSSGISAAIPTSLALVAAIAGEAKAAEVARALHVSDWSTRHDSQVFAPSFGRNLTAFTTTMAINPRLRRNEAVGIPLAAGADDIALAITADAYSRTGRGKAYAVAATAEPVRTRHGLIFVPDRVRGRGDAFDRLVQLPVAQAGEQLDAVLGLIERDYGRLTAFGVALEFEYLDFQ